MPYSHDLADRILALVPDAAGKPLFGGFGVFRRGVMFAGVWRSALMVKLGAGTMDALLEPHTSGFDPMGKGKPMRGWVVVDGPAVADDAALREWLERALAAVPITANRRRKSPGGGTRKKK